MNPFRVRGVERAWMVVTQPSETEVISAAKAGDSVAFERLVRANADAVYGHALRFFGDKSTAEDIVQEVFLKVYRTLDSFDGRSAFSTWLYRVTRNVCLDQLRASRRRPIPQDPLDTPDTPVEDFADETALRTALEPAMADLAEEDRDALNAISLYGMTYAEAGEALGVPPGTVKSRVFRARKALVIALGLDREDD